MLIGSFTVLIAPESHSLFQRSIFQLAPSLELQHCYHRSDYLSLVLYFIAAAGPCNFQHYICYSHLWLPKPCEYGCDPSNIYTTGYTHSAHQSSKHNGRWPSGCLFPGCKSEQPLNAQRTLSGIQSFVESWNTPWPISPLNRMSTLTLVMTSMVGSIPDRRSLREWREFSKMARRWEGNHSNQKSGKKDMSGSETSCKTGSVWVQALSRCK